MLNSDSVATPWRQGERYRTLLVPSTPVDQLPERRITPRSNNQSASTSAYHSQSASTSAHYNQSASTSASAYHHSQSASSPTQLSQSASSPTQLSHDVTYRNIQNPSTSAHYQLVIPETESEFTSAEPTVEVTINGSKRKSLSKQTVGASSPRVGLVWLTYHTLSNYISENSYQF